MLPLELLKVIFGALSRDDLDALMLANLLFRDIVLRDFAKQPFRYFAALRVCSNQSYVLVRTAENKHHCEDNDDFGRRMRLARVGKLEFLNTLFDENIFNALLPLRDAWRDGRIETPCSFASQSLFERAFSELLFCKSMFVITGVDGELTQPFVSLPAVRECPLLSVFRPPSPLTVAEILEWLKADARCSAPKFLEVGADELGDSVENLVQQLKTDFAESARARRFGVWISAGAYNGQSGRFVNRDTSEVLIVSIYGTDATARSVEVERKPIDDE